MLVSMEKTIILSLEKILTDMQAIPEKTVRQQCIISDLKLLIKQIKEGDSLHVDTQ